MSQFLFAKAGAMSVRARFLLIAALLPLAACISGTTPPDTVTAPNGTKTVVQTDSEQCKSSCNQDYARCMDSDPAQSSPVNGPSGMFGASSDCRSALSSCLPGCKSQ